MIKFIKSILGIKPKIKELQILTELEDSRKRNEWTTVGVILLRETFVSNCIRFIKQASDNIIEPNILLETFRYHTNYDKMCDVEIQKVGDALYVRFYSDPISMENYYKFSPETIEDFNYELSTICNLYIEHQCNLGTTQTIKMMHKRFYKLWYINKFVGSTIGKMVKLIRINNIEIINSDGNIDIIGDEKYQNIDFIFNEIINDYTLQLNEILLPQNLIFQLVCDSNDSSYNKNLSVHSDLTSCLHQNYDYINKEQFFGKLLFTMIEELITKQYKAIYQKELMYSFGAFEFKFKEEFFNEEMVTKLKHN